MCFSTGALELSKLLLGLGEQEKPHGLLSHRRPALNAGIFLKLNFWFSICEGLVPHKIKLTLRQRRLLEGHC